MKHKFKYEGGHITQIMLKDLLQSPHILLLQLKYMQGTLGIN